MATFRAFSLRMPFSKDEEYMIYGVIQLMVPPECNFMDKLEQYKFLMKLRKCWVDDFSRKNVEK